MWRSDESSSILSGKKAWTQTNSLQHNDDSLNAYNPVALFVMVLQNGHSFCTHCLTEWVEKNPTCPTDCLPLTQAQFVPILSLRNIISELEVHCAHHKALDENVKPLHRRIPGDTASGRESQSMKRKRAEIDLTGCDWTGRLEALQEHYKSECMIAPVACKFDGCEESL